MNTKSNEYVKNRWKYLFLSITILIISGCAARTGNFVDMPVQKCQAFGNELKVHDSYAKVRKNWQMINAKFQSKPRNLAVFLDGSDNDRRSLTNIWGMYQLAVAHACDGNPVIPYYDKGVGAKWFDLLQGAITGYGVSLNVRQAYRFLTEAYRPGDKIYIFGFSRGALTARSLNGFIEAVGLLKREFVKSKNGVVDLKDLRTIVADMYREYRIDTVENVNMIEKVRNNVISAGYELPAISWNVEVEFIGVFDTVPALGLRQQADPRKHRLDFYAKRGRHALSIDEQRKKFELLRFNNPNDSLLEVWFSGVHSDIGGSYDQSLGCVLDHDSNKDKSGLEATALKWMLNGLKFDNLFAKIQINECSNARLHDEYYKIKHKAFGKRAREPKLGDYIHYSVLQRLKSVLVNPHSKRENSGTYKPSNLPESYRVYKSKPD